LLTYSEDSFNQLDEKYDIEINFLQYYQIISAIPSIPKRKSAEQGNYQMNKLLTKNTFFLSENKSVSVCLPQFGSWGTEKSSSHCQFLRIVNDEKCE